MAQFYKSYKAQWPVTAANEAMVSRWCDIIFSQRRFESSPNGVDQFLSIDLEPVASKSEVILTRWIDPAEKSFYCVSGWALYRLFDWWVPLQKNFAKAGLTPWLEFPCVLLSRAVLSKHADIGRPTALNYPVFSEDPMTGYFWRDKNSADSDYLESYSYSRGEMLLLDTTKVHGGIPRDRELKDNVRAIYNMGFAEDYLRCRSVLDKMDLSALFEV